MSRFTHWSTLLPAPVLTEADQRAGMATQITFPDGEKKVVCNDCVVVGTSEPFGVRGLAMRDVSVSPNTKCGMCSTMMNKQTGSAPMTEAPQGSQQKYIRMIDAGIQGLGQISNPNWKPGADPMGDSKAIVGALADYFGAGNQGFNRNEFIRSLKSQIPLLQNESVVTEAPASTRVTSRSRLESILTIFGQSLKKLRGSTRRRGNELSYHFQIKGPTPDAGALKKLQSLGLVNRNAAEIGRTNSRGQWSWVFTHPNDKAYVYISKSELSATLSVKVAVKDDGTVENPFSSLPEAVTPGSVDVVCNDCGENYELPPAGGGYSMMDAQCPSCTSSDYDVALPSTNRPMNGLRTEAATATERQGSGRGHWFRTEAEAATVAKQAKAKGHAVVGPHASDGDSGTGQSFYIWVSNTTKNHSQTTKNTMAGIDPSSAGLYDEVDLTEREMTTADMQKRDTILRGMKRDEPRFKQKYGSRATDIMTATATQQAMEPGGSQANTTTTLSTLADSTALLATLSRNMGEAVDDAPEDATVTASMIPLRYQAATVVATALAGANIGGRSTEFRLSSGTPEQVVNYALRVYLRSPHTPESWMMIGKMLATIQQMGIVWDDRELRPAHRKLMGLEAAK